jgi:hypothetical protein
VSYANYNVGGGLYREPRLNKSESTALDRRNVDYDADKRNVDRRNVEYDAENNFDPAAKKPTPDRSAPAPLSPNSIDER